MVKGQQCVNRSWLHSQMFLAEVKPVFFTDNNFKLYKFVCNDK